MTFSSLIVAIQVASGQLSPRTIATTLLRDRGIRGSVSPFVYALLLAIAEKTRIDTIPRFLTSMTGILGLLSLIVFMFLIDHAARLLRPVNIVWRVAQQGSKFSMKSIQIRSRLLLPLLEVWRVDRSDSNSLS